MSIEVKVPALPESVTEATVAVWNKKPGDRVSRDEIICELETDKVMLEVPAIADGVLKEIKADEGATVGSGDVIALLDEGSSGGGDSGSGDDSAEAEDTADSDDSGDADGESPPLSPAVRKLVAEHDLDASKIKGTGKGGRIVKSDVEEYLAKQSDDGAKSDSRDTKAEAASKPAAKSEPVSVPSGDRVEQRVPMTRIRKRIAERLVEAQQTAAMLTTFNEVDLSAVMELRSRYKDTFAKSYDIKLGFMSFFVKAAVEALKRYPIVNASIDDDDVVYHGFYDVGIAVSTERGLVVPILRDAESMSFAEIEQAIANYGKKAREGKITMDDLQGGTFSITNGGIFGSMLSTPILNPPQSAIMGMHGIIERPVAVNGQVEIRPMMYLALSYDHRLIDGKDAVMFLRTIKETLEDPGRLLLQI